ncbi:PEP-CTERM protein-sorting domain-containing protein [Terrimicrobium sacchariphilum]|uniref:PEP-CTERM protein-sorting domain-containing protein n=1 Tax=Terrimicrobium sacchariphilum TaxID=690879 RepID=A0A146G4S6_TERSA|nr:PEP-CTERM sorting domain-containing protein [Terrimicrobium sacchariphilum]GAT32433.1 PEP-CTERM protein-sorting domain-containing protein [Terrimicrobium sacchariphilum]
MLSVRGMNRLCMIGLAVLVMSVASARSAVLFTINAVSDVAQLGYTSGQSLTFQFLVSEDYSSAESYFSSTANNWVDEVASAHSLFTSITSPGLAGTYVATLDPYAWVANDDTGFLNLYVDTEVPSASIGVTTPDDTAIKKIDIGIDQAASWTFPNAAVTPGTYFALFQGSLNIGANTYFSMYSVGGDSYDFRVTSASVGVVPEPSAWALFGFGVLGLMGWRSLRRRSLISR